MWEEGRTANKRTKEHTDKAIAFEGPFISGGKYTFSKFQELILTSQKLLELEKYHFTSILPL